MSKTPEKSENTGNAGRVKAMLLLILFFIDFSG